MAGETIENQRSLGKKMARKLGGNTQKNTYRRGKRA